MIPQDGDEIEIVTEETTNSLGQLTSTTDQTEDGFVQSPGMSQSNSELTTSTTQTGPLAEAMGKDIIKTQADHSADNK